MLSPCPSSRCSWASKSLIWSCVVHMKGTTGEEPLSYSQTPAERTLISIHCSKLPLISPCCCTLKTTLTLTIDIYDLLEQTHNFTSFRSEQWWITVLYNAQKIRRKNTFMSLLWAFMSLFLLFRTYLIIQSKLVF